MLRKRSHVLVAGLISLAVIGALASGSSAAAPPVTFKLTGSPGAVTPGYSVGYSGVITNTSASTLTNVVLVESVPGAGALQFKSFSRTVQCTALAGGGIRCALGDIASHDKVKFTTVFGLPADTHLDPLVNTARVEIGSSAFCANTLTAPPCAPSASTHVLSTDTTTQVGGYVGVPGSPRHTIGTDPAFSAANPHASSVDVPLVGTGVGVNVREGNGTSDPANPGAPPSFFQCPGAQNGCVGQWTFVGIPETEPPNTTPFTQSNPFEVLVFFSSFEQNLTSVDHFGLYKNGVLITDSCPFDAGSTVCVKSVTIDGSGTIVADLLETVNGYIGGGG
jgi:hypothetical protein